MNAAKRAPLHHYAIALAIWLLASVYTTSNLLPLQLFVDISARPVDVGTVFWTMDGNWSHALRDTQPLVHDWNRTIYALPSGTPIDHVLLTPREYATPYEIHSIRWERSGLFSDVPPGALAKEKSTSRNSAPAEDRISESRFEIEPRLVIPMPGLQFSLESLALAAAVPLLGLALLFFPLRRALDPARFAAAMLAGAALCCGFLVLRLGPILPLYDDWRYLLDGPCNLVDGGWAWLGCVANDTYYLTNQVLDAAVLHVSNVDFFWLRVVALLLLALQVAFQFRILCVVSAGSPATSAVAVASIIWSLGAGSYWGSTALAYQQALPTLCGTLCLALIVGRGGELNPRASIALLLLLAAASGLAYISGGLLLLSLSGALLFATRCGPSRRTTPEARIGWILMVAGAILLTVQLIVVSEHQGSLIDHNHASKSVFPTDRRFWIFFAALFGRALGYAGNSAIIDSLLALLVLGPGMILAALCLTRQRVSLRPAWSLLAIYAGAGCATYAAIVAFGRGGFIAADAGAEAITAFGKSRFHYWPVAAMLPYAWLGWTQLAALLPRAARPLQVLVAIALLTPKSLSTFDQKPALYGSEYMAAAGAHCVVTHRNNIDLSRPLTCPVMTGGDQDIAPTLRRLRDRGSPTFRRLMESELDKDGVYRSGFEHAQ